MSNSYYMIVTGTTMRSLVNSVSEAMEVEGWTPQGGVFVDRPSSHEIRKIHGGRDRTMYVAQTPGPPVYHQAMVRQEDTDDL